MDGNVDNELLISLVYDRPALWDKTLDCYKDRNTTKNMWREVCLALKPDFEELQDIEKNAFGKEIVRRWSNLRDSYVKSKKKQKQLQKSGSGKKTIKKYVFNDQLQFLNKIYDHRSTIDSMHIKKEVDEDPLRQQTECAEEITIVTAKETKRKAEPSTRKIKHYKPDDIEMKILKALEPEKEDNRMAFFNSLKPHIDQFSTNEFLRFQMSVLQVIAEINEKKEKAAQPLALHTPDQSSQSHLISVPPSLFTSSPFPNPSPGSSSTNQYYQGFTTHLISPANSSLNTHQEDSSSCESLDFTSS